MSNGTRLNPNGVGAILIGCVLAIFIGLFLLLAKLKGEHINVDPVSNCAEGDVSYPSTVVLVDRTDRVSPTQRKFLIEEYIDELSSSFRQFEKVAIYPIDPSVGAVPLPLFERCNPGNPEEASIWFENPRQIRQKFKAGFSDPFRLAVVESMADSSRGTSPIIDVIEAVMSNHSLDRRISSQRLVIVSDMLHNMPNFSHYRDGYDFEAYRPQGTPPSALTFLADTEVTLVYLQRPSMSMQDAATHRGFWEGYFNASRARLNHVYNVQ